LFIASDYFLDASIKISVGSLSPTINWSALKELEFELPSLDKQRQLAEVLWVVIDVKKAYIELLSLTEQLVKSQFVEMFGDPVRNEKGWMTIPLGALCSIYRGGSPRPIEQFLGGTIPWIKIGDATSSDDIFLHSTKDYIIEEGMKKSRFVKSGSLIFANCGVSLGFARIITFDGCIHDGWLSFEDIDKRLDKVFLLKSLNHCTEYFRITAPDGTQPNLNTGIMKSFRQILPPLPLQNRFAEFVRAADKSKFELQRSLDELEATYKAILRERLG
jgi:restriction endonuclease S subunit